jgi:hypothetical protein
LKLSNVGVFTETKFPIGVKQKQKRRKKDLQREMFYSYKRNRAVENSNSKKKKPVKNLVSRMAINYKVFLSLLLVAVAYGDDFRK